MGYVKHFNILPCVIMISNFKGSKNEVLLYIKEKL